ncbi:hypothetical protein AB0C18_43095 [Nonomuraea muscovyensis]|uniref:hypothetical protein n=1 Tax=Nonomuraea muscovyensis TaxID=1124761 RepID=UPI0033E346D0
MSRQVEPVIRQAAPRTSALPGVGTDVATQLLTTAGDNPDPAALRSRPGDCGANPALRTIVLRRMRYGERTRVHLQRRTREDLSKPEILRCLKRYTALRADFAVLAP